MCVCVKWTCEGSLDRVGWWSARFTAFVFREVFCVVFDV